MGPRPLFTEATTEADDSEVAGDVGSAIITLPFSCTAQVVGDAMLLVVVVVVVADTEVDEADEDVTIPLMETTLELLATVVVAVLALLAPPPTPAEPAAIGLVIFM